MISIKKARELIGDENMSDEEVEKVRDALYELGELALDIYFREQNAKKEKSATSTS